MSDGYRTDDPLHIADYVVIEARSVKRITITTFTVVPKAQSFGKKAYGGTLEDRSKIAGVPLRLAF